MMGILSKRASVFFVAVFLCVLFELFSAHLALAGKSSFPELAYKLALDTETILVNRGVCATLQECTRQERVKMSGTPDNATIYIYQAGGINKETIADIISNTIFVYNTNQELTRIKIMIYRETLREKIKMFSGVKPFIKFELIRRR